MRSSVTVNAAPPTIRRTQKEWACAAPCRVGAARCQSKPIWNENVPYTLFAKKDLPENNKCVPTLTAVRARIVYTIHIPRARASWRCSFCILHCTMNIVQRSPLKAPRLRFFSIYTQYFASLAKAHYHQRRLMFA